MDLKFKLLIKLNENSYDIIKCTLDDKNEEYIATCKTLEKAKWIVDALANGGCR